VFGEVRVVCFAHTVQRFVVDAGATGFQAGEDMRMGYRRLQGMKAGCGARSTSLVADERLQSVFR
jgi:hypothetical protein